MQTGAVLLPVQLWYPSYGRMSIRVRPAIPVPEEGKRPEKVAVMCQQLADNYAEGIAAHPADWHMMQKFFLADLDPAKAPKARPAEETSVSEAAEACRQRRCDAEGEAWPERRLRRPQSR